MPTIITHAVVPIAIAIAVGRNRIAPAVAATGAVLAMVPDADVIGFRLGIAYADQWGHRGASHSLALALVFAALAIVAFRAARNRLSSAFLLMAAASHGLLDMLTDGGLGVALLWPFDTARHFFAWTPIRVSPIGAGFFSGRGMETVLSELVWIWLPITMLSVAVRRTLTNPLGQGTIRP